MPGGPHTDIFGHEEDDDALSHAPPKPVDTPVRPRSFLYKFFFFGDLCCPPLGECFYDRGH